MILTAVFLVLLTMRSAYSVEPREAFAQTGDARIGDWYDVEDWELEVCREWGGIDSPQSNADVSQAPLFISQTAIALQAEKEVLPDGNIIYTVSYYIQPLQDVHFAVRLRNSITGGLRTIVAPTLVEQGESNADFYPLTTGEVFDRVEMAIGTESTVNTIVTMPIIDETYIGCTTDCGTSTVADPWDAWD